MMDREHGAQQKMLCVTMESLMPEKHFLRDLDRLVDFSFVYDKVAELYSNTGRRSVDPVVIVKMMLLGYLYGIDSERRLEQEVQVNIAYRWFLGINLDEPVPDHSTFSQLRRRKFNGTTLFEDIFEQVVRLCIEKGLITGKLLLTDSTHVRANARNDLYETITVADEPSAYLQRLNEQAVAAGLLKEDYKEKQTPKTKEIKISTTDPESGYMHRPGKPNGFHYLSHQTCDGEHGLITDVFVTPGNINDRSVHSERIKTQIDKYGFETEAVCADKGYDSSEIHAEYKPIYLVRLFHLKKIVFRYPTINMTKSPIRIVALPDIQFLTNTMIMNKVERFIIAETWNAVNVRTEINVSVVNPKEN